MHIGHARQPVLIESFQLIEILRLFGQHEIVRGKQHREHILLITQNHFPGFIQSLLQYDASCIFPTHLHVFIEQLETSKHNLRQRAVILYVARLEAIQSIQSSHYNLARMQSFEGTLVEVTTLQPVLVVIGIATEHGLFRLAVNGQHHVYQFSSGADPYTFVFIFRNT